MFYNIAEELERLIWKSFWSRFILSEIKSYKPIWLCPSIDLLYNSSDLGALQYGCSDLERTFFYKDCSWPCLRYEIYKSCFFGGCNDCINGGFPCNDAVACAGLDKKLGKFWDMSFYKNLLAENEERYIGALFI